MRRGRGAIRRRRSPAVPQSLQFFSCVLDSRVLETLWILPAGDRLQEGHRHLGIALFQESFRIELELKKANLAITTRFKVM